MELEDHAFLDKAEQYLQEQKYHEADTVFSEVLKIDPANPRAGGIRYRGKQSDRNCLEHYCGNCEGKEFKKITPNILVRGFKG